METIINTPKELLKEVLRDALFGKQAHVTLERALEGLQWHQAGLQVPDSPHTIWQQLKHLNYWQDRFISRMEGMKVLPAKSSDDGWCFPQAPSSEGDFRKEVGKLLTSINYIAELLQREAEGNTFFLIEVVRTLAEQAGRLEDIKAMALPNRVFAGGVQEIVQRRLQYLQI